MERVAVIGAGLMGAQIGAEYALGGHAVTLWNRTRDSARDALRRARDALRTLKECGLCTSEAAAAAMGRLSASTNLKDAARDATLLIESVPEDMALKTAVLREAAQAAPGAIIASNTSSLSIGSLGCALEAEERTLGTHYWNPPTLMPLVEVVPGPRTSPEVTDRVVENLTALGKEPVVVRDIPGFIWNRLQLALLREAVALVQQGAAPPQTVDLILRRGLGRRWSLVGPFEAMALGGPATFATVAGLLWPKLAREVDPNAILEVALPDPKTLAGVRQRRDQALARMLIEDRGQVAAPTTQA